MAIHGVVSTYFGDLEYDIGKSLNWTRYFCDTTYIMDTNSVDASRRYVVDWAKAFPDVKYSFFVGSPSFFGSPSTAADWRKESFLRARKAWKYSDTDWVLFIDGTEALNVYHEPPKEAIPVAVSTDTVGQTLTVFTAEDPHGIAVGNIATLDQVRVSASPVAGADPVEYSFDGKFLVLSVTSDSFTVYYSDPMPSVTEYSLDTGYTPLAVYTNEPPGYYDGALFQSWINAEIAAAQGNGKSLISLDGWAMIRSEMSSILLKVIDTGFTSSIFGITTDGDGDPAVLAPRCDEFYLPMGNLIRLAQVGTLADPDFDWSRLDQPQVSLTDAHQADLLSVISYAYLRWAENPTDMTQSVDPDAPHYVAGDAANPPLRPVSIESDAGFAMRRFISTVRPLEGAPTDWEDPDDDGVQPMVGDYQKLDTYMYATVDEGSFDGYLKYGGSPLYPGVVRKNLREGVWYTSTPQTSVRYEVSAVAYAAGVITVTTAKDHKLVAGQKVTVYGTSGSFQTSDAGYGVFDGEYVIASVPTSNSFTYIRDLGSSFIVTQTPVSDSYIITMTSNMGSVPWNYLLNTFSVGDPFAWIKAGSRYV